MDIELETAVFHRAHVDEGRREKIGRNRHVVVAEKVFLGAVEIVEGAAQPVIQQCEVQAYVPVYSFFPAEVRIYISCRAPDSEVLTIVVIVSETCHCVE